jgi:DNA repair protein SbcD/Mre11
VKFVHAADLHLDSPMKGLAEYPGAPVDAVRGATRVAFESLIELCIAEQADLLLVAGDLFDQDWNDFRSGLYLRAQLGRLREAGVEVVLLRGNHDAASVITRNLTLPGIHVLPHNRAATVVLDDIGAAVHGQSFATAAVTENLAAGYPAPHPGLVNIGVLHTCLGGYDAHANYAPCALEELVAHGYDYWALGHVHTRAVLNEAPYVVFSGNLQGRQIREAGPKGATLVEVADGGWQVTEHELDHVRWARARVDAGGAVDYVEVLERAQSQLRAALTAAGGRLLAARVEIAGITSAHNALVRERERLDAELCAMATDLGHEQVWLERIVWQTSAPRSTAIGDDAVGETIKVLRRAAADPETIAALAERLRPLRVKLPAGLLEDCDPTDSETLVRLIGEVEQALPGMLLERAGA